MKKCIILNEKVYRQCILLGLMFMFVLDDKCGQLWSYEANMCWQRTLGAENWQRTLGMSKICGIVRCDHLYIRQILDKFSFKDCSNIILRYLGALWYPSLSPTITHWAHHNGLSSHPLLFYNQLIFFLLTLSLHLPTAPLLFRGLILYLNGPLPYWL